MPSGVAGVEVRGALKKASAWGAAVACATGDGILMLPSSLRKDAPIEIDDSMGTFFSKDGLPGTIKVEGDLLAYLRYDGLDVPIALAMGIAGAPAQQGAAAAYGFTYRFATSVDGLFASFAQHMKNYIMEIPSLKVTGFTIKGETGKAVEITFHTISINKVYDSAVNTTATFDNVTYFEQQNRIKFSESVFRMNDQGGAALGSGDRIYPSSFELSVKRKLKGEYTGEFKYTGGSNVQDLIDEPTNDGMPEISLKIVFPRHTGTTYLAALGTDTRKKMDITFTGANIASAYNRTFALRFPHLQLRNDDPADAAGIIREPLEFIVHGAVTAPVGMTGCTDPLWISGINKRSTDPLA